VDKLAIKLPIGQGKYVYHGQEGCSHQICHRFTSDLPLHRVVPPKCIMKAILKLERALLWMASDKLFRDKRIVKWDLVCCPKSMGGLRVLDLENFTRALRLRLSWFELTKLDHAWVGLWQPCDDADMENF
jgi:hypothetical protein